MDKIKLGIFTSFDGGDKYYVAACKELGVDYEIVDILSADWIKNVYDSGCEGFLCSSTCDFQERKSILDERYFFISQIMKKEIYPTFTELYIHENKRNMATWLEINGFPHVVTKVFTNKKEADKYFSGAEYPIVLKSNLGSGAKKVRIIVNSYQAKRFSKKVFPFSKWQSINLGYVYFNKFLGIRILPDLANNQKFYLIAQEYKDIVCEWRIIKIGESYFGHQKLLKGKFASGSGKVGWVDPPKELLLMVKNVCDKGNFRSMNLDIFETKAGEYFINELQSSFGSYDNSQMYIEGKPGRYKLVEGKFVFEEGYFNVHCSNKLRVEHFLNILRNK